MQATQTNVIQRVHQIGQSFWLDYIRRDMLTNGELRRLIDDGEIRGVTSNPTIFEKAIAQSNLYDAAMRPLAHAGWSAERIFENLAVEDIRAATDLFLPLYEGTAGKDGFVSIEVTPTLAHDTQATLEEARRLWQAVNRPNLMVKIPATAAGIPAIQEAIAEAINVNVTLIFALDRYAEVMQAYLRGLERRAEAGQPLERIASVASFFVSRVDTEVDQRLEQIVREEGAHAPRAAALQGRAAVANAKLAYAQFKSTFGAERFDRLRERGAQVQRPLWASTSTKNPAYSDVLYVEELIGPDTVNTLPPQTLTAFRQHGRAEATIELELADARAQLQAIEGLGIELDQVTALLEQQGVQAFTDSYLSLIEVVEQRTAQMRSELGRVQPSIAPLLDRLEQGRVTSRYWRADPGLWPKGAGEPVLDFARVWRDQLPQVEQALEAVAPDGRSRIGWLAPGGARWPLPSPGPGLLAETLDPVEQRMFQSDTPIDSTLFVAVGAHPRDPALEAVLELNWQRAVNRLGERAGGQFLIAAAEESQLAELGRQRGVALVLGRAEAVGGLVAAGLSGSGLASLLEGAERTRDLCAPNNAGPENPGLYLGAALAAAGEAEVRRLALLADPQFAWLADWLCYRLESSGVGSDQAVFRTVPAPGEREDRLLIYLRSTGELDRQFAEWGAAGVPCLLLEAANGAGGEAVRWEMGLGIAAHLAGTDPHPPALDERAAARLTKIANKAAKRGQLKGLKPDSHGPDGSVWWSIAEQPAAPAVSAADYAGAVARRLQPGSVLNLGIFRRRSHTLERTLEALAAALWARATDLRVVYGRAPEASGAQRDSGWQIALLLSESPKKDLAIPGQAGTFAELQRVQALAAYEELSARRLEAGMLELESPATVNNWLRTLIRELGG